MARRKRASMREGPLADLFRSTVREEEEQPIARASARHTCICGESSHPTKDTTRAR